MKNNKLDFLAKIVFFGAIWGIVEATLGYVLHLLPGFLAGSLMFPFVMVILYKAYKSTGSKKAIIYVAIIAMMIKATNLFLPFMIPAKTINPMVSMLLESLLVLAVMPLLDNENVFAKFGGILVASIGWRFAFIGYQGANYLITDYMAQYLQNFGLAFDFVVLQGIISATIALVILFVFVEVKALKKLDKFRINPAMSLATFVLAIVLTLLV